MASLALNGDVWSSLNESCHWMINPWDMAPITIDLSPNQCFHTSLSLGLQQKRQQCVVQMICTSTGGANSMMDCLGAIVQQQPDVSGHISSSDTFLLKYADVDRQQHWRFTYPVVHITSSTLTANRRLSFSSSPSFSCCVAKRYKRWWPLHPPITTSDAPMSGGSNIYLLVCP